MLASMISGMSVYLPKFLFECSVSRMNSLSRIASIGLFPDQICRHTSNVLGAIYLLSKRHGIPLHYQITPKALVESIQPGISFAEFHRLDGSVTRVCYDMLDWPQIASLDHLSYCDFYMKRSFLDSEVAKVSSALRQKILPFGLYFPFSPNSVSYELNSHLKFVLSSGRASFQKFRSSLHCSAINVARLVLKREPPFTRIESLEGMAGGGQQVLFQVRLWDPQTNYSNFSKTIEQINQTRIDLVRNLKKNFGSRFVGGITPSAYSKKVCPELISSHSASSKDYLKLVSASKICIAEEGLHGSHGAKFGEYFAAGRCVVSEPSFYRLPFPPRDGEDLLEFKGVDHCMAQVEKLLSSAALVNEVSANARKLYQSKLNPVFSVGRVIS